MIQAVNHAKDTLRQVTKTYKTQFKMNPTRPIREILAKNGYGYLALKQVYRHIHYIEHQPTRISWMKAKTYSSDVLTIDEARKALCQAGQGEHLDIQLAKLDMLQTQESLVKRREMQSWIVNITYYHQEIRHHRKIATSLPIFYLRQDGKSPPIVGFSKQSKRKSGTIRSDKKVEETPFLQSINTYRYKENYR